ncbi:MAG: 4'-phosphopantetheinyl transferase superfamily protein [Clostridiales Family XIII bacterium]|jgi:phosphopantetheinyl transferase|nr:4'-phosphopantetheinyl transferase superfamily protein [Clostridiales Family XIII bacterium]
MKLYLHNSDKNDEKNALAACVNDFCGRSEAVEIGLGAHGKPYFAEPALRGTHFSVSHSGRYWAALFADAEVGLDIEDISIRGRLTEAKMEKIAARFFSEAERVFFSRGADAAALSEKNLTGYSDSAIRFFNIWTAKESYIKYTGNGMSEGLASFSVFDPPGGVTITTMSPAPALLCSYCTSGEEEPEVVWLSERKEKAAIYSLNDGTCNDGTCNDGTCNDGTCNDGTCNDGKCNDGQTEAPGV